MGIFIPFVGVVCDVRVFDLFVRVDLLVCRGGRVEKREVVEEKLC